MPRGPRLDAPGTLHHVMVRGIERRAIFRDDRDRDDFVRRLAGLAEAGALAVYAWALLPNHAHLLVRTGSHPLARSLRSLLTGYAGAFNRRHRRIGHLFQNRYKSVAVEEEPYFLQLVRYLHLNPLRSGVVADLRALDRYPYSGHTALMGGGACHWQDTREVLRRFAVQLRRSRRLYREFVADGIAQGRRPDLQGGGLIRSVGGWDAVRTLRRGRERYVADERILGSSAFVERIREEMRVGRKWAGRGLVLEALVRKVCHAVQVRPEALQGGGRHRAVCRAREGIAYLWIEVLGRSGRPLAAALAVRPQSVYRAAQRGREAGVLWEHLLGRSAKSE